jgi:iron complex outermembrane recepter protein
MNPQNNRIFYSSQLKHRWQKAHRLIFSCSVLVALALLNPFCSRADVKATIADDLTLLPFEELVRVKVTTVSKKPEHLFESASAVYVITGEDIQRSGYTTIAEALRLAPGMQVARLGSHQWAISSRGFAGLYANKLLVLVDGRSVYTPLNSGVHWDTVDTLLEDVDRIEVVRGPGGTLWGANAVNGVVNIITKSAKETQGIYADAGGGTLERAFAGMRYGGKAGDVYYRVYANYFDRAEFDFSNGSSAQDDWHKAQGGFRLDWEPSIENLFTLQGDIYSGTESGMVVDTDVAGGNLLGRWTHDFSLDAQSKLQVYYDRFVRDNFAVADIQTFDVDFQHRFALGERQELIFGGGYRLIDDYLGSSPAGRHTPKERTVHLPSAFIQDEITIAPDLLRLTLGTKVEHHYFSGWEVQPSARLLWTPHENHTAWASVSRAVRTPSRSEHDVRATFATVPGPTNTIYASDMRGRVDSEDVLAYEIGYRIQPLEEISFDLATFYNVYDKFATFEPATPFLETTSSSTNLIIPFEVRNKAHGETYGGELAARWQAADWWRIDASYTYLQIQLHAPNSKEVSAEFAERESPHHQIALRSAMNCPRNTEFDWIIRYVDSIPGFGVSSYVTMDVRLAWKPSPNWELSLVGQNLLDNEHLEFGDVATVRQRSSEVPRGFYGKLTCRF